MKDHFVMFAEYNRWANALIYDAAQAMDEADYRRDAGLFFGSVHATLNHILVADTIWMARFGGRPNPPLKLDDILHDDFTPLRRARKEMDDEIVAWIDGETDESLTAEFTYTPVTDPTPVTQRLAPALAHLFNHQTHHRGQAHGIVTRFTDLSPAMDLIYYQRAKRLGEV